MSKELTTEMLEELRTQITSYFEAYYSALTAVLIRVDLAANSRRERTNLPHLQA
jgi:hypothetical protein